MAQIEYQGLKVSGGKIFIILSLLGTLGGAAWTGFTFYQDYLDMKAKIQEYTAPDLSSYDEQIAVIKSELDMILEEVSLISEITRDMKNELKVQIREIEQDVRHITTIVNDVEDRQKEDTREIFDEIKIIEENLNLNINKALNNPLSGMSATSK